MPHQPNQSIASHDLHVSIAEYRRLRADRLLSLGLLQENGYRLIQGSRRGIAESKDLLSAADRLLRH